MVRALSFGRLSWPSNHGFYVGDLNAGDAALAEAGPLHALIANAGRTVRGTVEATPIAEYERLMDLNFLGSLRLVKGSCRGSAAGGRPALPARCPTGSRPIKLAKVLTHPAGSEVRLHREDSPASAPEFVGIPAGAGR